MADVNDANTTEETQPESVEPQEQETPVEEAKPEEAEAKSDETEGEDEPAAEEKPGQSEEQRKSDEKHRRDGGWKRKIDKLERELATFRAQQSQQPAAQPTKELSAEEKAAEYVDKLVEQRLAAREAQREQQTRFADFQRRSAEVRAAHSDFDDALESVSDIPVSQAVQEALVTSEHGPAIMYQLAKSPAELARLSALPPLIAAREIGRLEAKLSSSTAAPRTQTKSATRPPAPPTSVGGKATSTRSLEDLPLSDYKRAYRSGRR